MDLLEYHINEKDSSCVLFNLPPDVAAIVLELGKTVWPVDLHEKGRETEPHVTALYGLTETTPSYVACLAGQLGPVTLTFGEVSVFQVPEKGFDVVKLEVKKTPDLMTIRQALEKRPRVASMFPTYEPHVTLAYVKPGQGDKYCGECELTGTSCTVRELTFSDPDEKKATIPLLGDVHQKVNGAVTATGYTLRTTAAKGYRLNEQDEEGNEGRWVTMSGTPVFIKDGEDAGTAAARTFKNKQATEEPQKKEGVLKKWLREKTAPLREAFEQGRAGAKPSPMRKAIPVTSKPAAVSGKIQRIREVGLGAKETVAELFYKRHVDEVFSGKVTAADKVDALMKKGVIKTGSEKPDVVRERAIRDFDKAVILREQAAADRTESGEGKRAYTDKTLRAGLQKGETLAERYFPGHVDDLYNGTTSVTAKVDSMIEGGELGFGRGDKGFIKMRETAIKDFTRALNLREAADVREEKRKIEDAKPKKLTKREQQAAWTPSEEEILASGPVVSSGTGWKRNMAENQPRDEDGKWTDGGGGLVDDLIKVYGKRTAPSKGGHGWLSKDGLFIDTNETSHPAMLQRAMGAAGSTLKIPELYNAAFKEGMVRYDAGLRVVEFAGQPTKQQLYAVARVFEQRTSLKREVFVDMWRSPEARLKAELANKSHGFFTSHDWDDDARRDVKSFFDKSDAVPAYVSPFAQFRQNAFDPNQPRDTDGKWTGGTLSFKGEPEKVGAFTKDVAIRRSTVTGPDGKPVMTWHNPDGSQVTDPRLLARVEQITGTKATAPNYKGAWLNPNMESPLLAIAFDSKDRKHYVYSKEFEQGNAEEKFKIVAQMEKDLPAMRGQAAKDRSDGVPEAYLFKLEDLTCIRVGSGKDTGAEKKAYGLTTLRGEHVKVEGDLIKLEFPAKGGDVGSYVVKDKELAAFITERKAANGDGELWPDVTAEKFNAYLKKLDPTPDSPVTAHKFRHYHATRLAEAVVAQYEGKTLGAKEFKAVQREACEAAAAHLANTWSVCREKYVNPTVWGRLTVSR